MVVLLGFLCTHAATSQTAELFVQLGHTDRVSSVAWSPDGHSLASGSGDQTVKVWDVQRGELLRTLSGHTNWVSSVAWSPDGRRLASGSSSVTIWADDSEAMKVRFALLPGNEWLAYHPQKLVYNSSLQGDEYAAIRFDQNLRPVYPLVYYRQQLKRPDLAQAFLLPQPEIAPKWLRLRWDSAENKGWWLGGLLLVTTAGLVVTLVLRKRSDPMEVARRFFSQARFQKVEPLARDLLLLQPQDGHTPGIAALWQEGQHNGTLRLASTVHQQAQRLGTDLKLYIVYKDQGLPVTPSSSYALSWAVKPFPSCRPCWRGRCPRRRANGC